MPPTFLVISGTNRPEANALRVARLVHRQYEALNVPARLYSLAELPPELFLPAAYKVKPPAFEAIRQAVIEAAGLHVITPEYNGSFPGVLKYFIDHLKFPDSFERKPVAFIGESDGRFGALRSVEQLQQIFGYRNAYLYPSRVFIPNIETVRAENGGELSAELVERINEQVEGFVRFAGMVGAQR